MQMAHCWRLDLGDLVCVRSTKYELQILLKVKKQSVGIKSLTIIS